MKYRSALLATLVLAACDKKAPEPSAPAAPPSPPAAQAPSPAAQAAEAKPAEPAAEAKPAEPAAEAFDLELKVSGGAFDAPVVVRFGEGALRPMVFGEELSLAKTFDPRVPAVDPKVTLGSLVFSLKGQAPGVYDQSAFDLTLGLEREGTGGQPMWNRGQPSKLELTRHDAEAIEGTFTATLERTNNSTGTPDLYQVEGRFDFERKRK